MNFYEEGNPTPDFLSKSYDPSDSWIEGRVKGIRIIEPEELLKFTSFTQFLDYLLEAKWLVTVTTSLKEIDRLFELTNPLFCARMASPIIEEADWEGYKVEIRPTGKPLKKGVLKLTVRKGGRQGAIINLVELCPDISLLSEVLPTLTRHGITLTPNVGLSGTLRYNLHRQAGAAFRGRDEIPKEAMQLARSSFRIGRFEDLVTGTVEGKLYDLRSAYPKEVAYLQCACPNHTEWIEITQDVLKEAVLNPQDYPYIFAEIEAEVPKSEDGIYPLPIKLRSRNGTVQSFPYGKFRTFVGAATIRFLHKQGIPTDVKRGWVGRIVDEYRPFYSLVSRLQAGRREGYRLFKLLDTRLAGNFVGEYPTLKDEDNKLVPKLVGLSTWHPIYGASVIDTVLAKLSQLAIDLKSDSVYSLRIDGILVSDQITLPVGEGWGEFKEPLEGKFTVWTDKFLDRPGRAVWADRYDGEKLHIPRTGKRTLGICFSHPLNLEESWKMFLSSDPGEYLFPLGSRKRRANLDGLDVLSDARETGEFSIQEAWDYLNLHTEFPTLEDLEDWSE